MTFGLLEGGPDIAAWGLLLALLAAIAITDGRTRRIPNSLNAALLLSGLGVSGMDAGPGLPAALAGSLLGGAVLLGLAVAFRRLRGIEGLGLGDVKFLVGAGAWTGWQGVGPVITIAAVTALLWLAARRLAGATIDRHAPIAFGPFLCVALLTVRAAQRV